VRRLSPVAEGNSEVPAVLPTAFTVLDLLLNAGELLAVGESLLLISVYIYLFALFYVVTFDCISSVVIFVPLAFI
jgi:hypothetical protein